MAGLVKRLLGSLYVEENDTHIHIGGFKSQYMTRDIEKVWKTSRIANNMFTRVDRSRIVFPKFFAPDVVYLIDQICEYKGRYSNVRVLTKIRNLLLSQTWLATTQQKDIPSRLDWRRLNELKLTPLPKQKEFIEAYDTTVQAYHLNGWLLDAAAGAGKTFTTLALSHLLKYDLTIVLCPKNAVYRVWEDNIVNRVFKTVPGYWIADQNQPIKGSEKFFIFHYERLEQALELIRTHPVFKDSSPMVILDESHNFNELVSLRTQTYIKLCQESNSRDIIHASGTSFKALAGEARPMLRVMDPYFTSDAEERYARIFGRNANKGLDILRHRLGFMSFKIEKSALNLEKPEIHTQRITMPNAKTYTLATIRQEMQAFITERLAYYKKHYNSFEDTYDQCLTIFDAQIKTRDQRQRFDLYKQHIKTIRKGYDPELHKELVIYCNQFERKEIIPILPANLKEPFRNARSVVKYVALKVQGECLGRILGGKRAQCHVDMAQYLDVRAIVDASVKKTVVFTSYVPALEALQRRCSQQDLQSMVVYGKTNNDLKNLIDRFAQDEDINPLIATYQSLSTAVPLVMADQVIMFNAPFRSHEREQAISRVHRLDATTQVHVYDVFLDTGNEPNISTRSVDILAWSQSQVEAITGTRSIFEIEQSSLEHLDDPEDTQDALPVPEHSLESFADPKVALSSTVSSQRW